MVTHGPPRVQNFLKRFRRNGVFFQAQLCSTLHHRLVSVWTRLKLEQKHSHLPPKKTHYKENNYFPLRNGLFKRSCSLRFRAIKIRSERQVLATIRGPHEPLVGLGGIAGHLGPHGERERSMGRSFAPRGPGTEAISGCLE